MNGVPRAGNCRAAGLIVNRGHGAPEVVEWPTLVSEVREESESEPQGQAPLNRPIAGLLSYLIHCCERSAPKLRHTESHGEHV
jgi:hypothetical protein